MTNAIEVLHLAKAYKEGTTQEVLKDVSFSVSPGEIVAIMGPSGAGKSTLLHALGGLATLDAGSVKIAGVALETLSDTELGRLRNKHLGFVYQFHHLQPEFTAEENVAMPLRIARVNDTEALSAAREALMRVGLAGKENSLPSQLSGGERQRVAIARAIVTRPTCVLADEPTGNLDSDTAHAVFQSFVALAREAHSAILIVTHDKEIAASCDRMLELKNGSIRPL